ncbi:MAG TPA: chemotaxis protein CheA [Cellvibrionaceae bacterium]
MSFGEDDEILQDFLVEAGEILDKLSEQLVDLEQRPNDRDLLNAIFRGFHTVKGGAGFLQLDAMVACCHITENLFDILRNGQRTVTSELMDVVLQSLDTVNAQFAAVSARQEAIPASPELIARLERLVSCEDLKESASAPAPLSAPSAPAQPVSVESGGGINLSDDEYEGLLEAINRDKSTSSSASKKTTNNPALKSATEDKQAVSEDISESEFESLLDQLHGAGKAPGIAAAPRSHAPESMAAQKSVSADEISDAEFENLLDQLHGSGKGPGRVTSAAAATQSSTPATALAPDVISDDEFEHLLDQLHGRGKGPTSTELKAAAPMAPTPIARSESAAQEPPAARTGHVAVAAVAAPGAPVIRAAPPARVIEADDEGRSREGSPQAVATETTVRVDTQRLDDIMNMVGELVLVRNRLVRLGLDSSDEALAKAVANLDVVTADLQTAVMKTRMQPIKKVFGRFPRVVRDLARNLKKEINLDLVGEETDLDKNLVEALADPLVHLVRNSVDHGIELPALREAAGKPRTGKIILSAEQEGDHILLSITDDGGGMDPQKLREKAIEKGIVDPDAAARLSDMEAFNLIFAPGFSTKAEISDISGRGVGMDVVKTKISQLNGSIEIFSKIGEGTRIAIKVPLTLAIMPTLMIMLGKQTFALPLVSVNEIFHMDLTKAHIVDGQECVTVRAKAIPIFHLKRWLVKGLTSFERPKQGHVVIVNVGTRRVGFVVDQLIGQEEVVIKPLGKMLQGTPGMAGATITGDGTIALILDVPSMLKRYVGG